VFVNDAVSVTVVKVIVSVVTVVELIVSDVAVREVEEDFVEEVVNVVLCTRLPQHAKVSP